MLFINVHPDLMMLGVQLVIKFLDHIVKIC
jgi:hypothetical protein